MKFFLGSWFCHFYDQKLLAKYEFYLFMSLPFYHLGHGACTCVHLSYDLPVIFSKPLVLSNSYYGLGIIFWTLLFLNLNHFYLGPVELHESFIYSYLMFERVLTINDKIPFLSHLFCSIFNTIASHLFFLIFIFILWWFHGGIWYVWAIFTTPHPPLPSASPSSSPLLFVNKCPSYFHDTPFIFTTYCFHVGFSAWTQAWGYLPETY